MAKKSVKKNPVGRPKGFSPGKKKKVSAAKKPMKTRQRLLPDFVKGNYIIVDEKGELTWNHEGWFSIFGDLDVKTFESKAQAKSYISKNEDLVCEEHNPEVALMSDYFNQNWVVSPEGIITSTLRPAASNPSPRPLKALVKARRQSLSTPISVIKAQLRVAEKALEKFNVSMEKYGL